MAKRPDPAFTVVIDTREQQPYCFPRSVTATLPTGDYSLLGLENRVAIERKTQQDAYMSLGRERPRFARELERLAALDYAAVVIEASVPDFLRQPPFSRMNPKAALNSIIGWSVKYRVCVFFAGDRRHAGALTYRLLEKYWRYLHEGIRPGGRT